MQSRVVDGQYNRNVYKYNLWQIMINFEIKKFNQYSIKMYKNILNLLFF